MEKNPMLRLSPNEVDSIIKKETDKWRIFRIQQVREQAREQAIKVRSAVREEENKQKEKIKQNLELDWLTSQKLKLSKLKHEYDTCISDVGQAHQRAVLQNKAKSLAREKLNKKNALANQRGREAMKSIENRKDPPEIDLKNRRQNLKETEKLRARTIASQPIPKKFVIDKSKPPMPKRVMLHEAGTFTTSTYIPKSIMVKKEPTVLHKNAKHAAYEERKMLLEIKENKIASDALRDKVAAQRANEALKKEKIKNMYADVMKELANIDESDLLSDIGRIQGAGQLDVRNDDDASQAKMERKVEFVLNSIHKYPCDTTESSASEFSMSSEATTEAETVQSNENQNIPEELKDTRWVSGSGVTKEGLFLQNRFNDNAPLESQIHLKETVPISKLAQTSDKYVIRVGSIEDPVSSTVKDSCEGSETIRSSLPQNSSEDQSLILDVDHTQESSRNVDVGLEKLCYNSPPEKYTLHSKKVVMETSPKKKAAQPSNSGNFRTHNNEFKFMNRRLETILEKCSQSTEHQNISGDANPDQMDIWDKLDQLRSNRGKTLSLISKLGHKIDNETNKKVSNYVTPTKLYNEEIKDEGSNQKPVSKRSKFERQKQLVVKHYLNKLLQMKKRGEELQFSVSESTGITFATMSPFSDESCSRTSGYTSSAHEEKNSTDYSSLGKSQTSESTTSTGSSLTPSQTSSTVKSSSISLDWSPVTTIDSSSRLTSSSNPLYSSESTVTLAPQLKSLYTYKYVDIDDVPVRESSSQESSCSPSLYDQKTRPSHVRPDDPAVQRRLIEIYTRLDELKRLRHQLIIQEKSAENEAIPPSNSDENISTVSIINHSIGEELSSCSSSRFWSDPNQFSPSDIDTVRKKDTIDGSVKDGGERLDSFHTAGVPTLKEETPYADKLAESSDKSLNKIESKSSSGASTNSSSIPDVSEFLKKLGFDTDKINKLIDNDNCVSSGSCK